MAGPYKTGGDWQPGMPKPGDPNWHGPMAAPMGNPPVAPPAAAPAQAAPAVNNEGPIDLGGGLGDGIMQLLEGLFGKAFGGEAARPGYKWDGFEGWVPDGSAPAAAPAPVAPKPAGPAPAAGGGPAPQNFKNYVGKQGL